MKKKANEFIVVRDMASTIYSCFRYWLMPHSMPWLSSVSLSINMYICRSIYLSIYLCTCSYAIWWLCATFSLCLFTVYILLQFLLRFSLALSLFLSLTMMCTSSIKLCIVRMYVLARFRYHFCRAAFFSSSILLHCSTSFYCPQSSSALSHSPDRLNATTKTEQKQHRQ